MCVIVLSLSDTNIQREVATDWILAPLTTESHVWAHAFFRQLPPLCIFNTAETASSMTSSSKSSSYSAFLQLKERSHEGSSHCGLYCGGSRLQLWNQQEVIACLHTLMFNYSQPPTGCVGWALSSLMGTRWCIWGTESCLEGERS